MPIIADTAYYSSDNETMTTSTEFLSMAQAAAIADLSPSTLKNQASKGRLRAEKLGQTWVTTRAWLQTYLDSRQHVKASK